MLGWIGKSIWPLAVDSYKHWHRQEERSIQQGKDIKELKELVTKRFEESDRMKKVNDEAFDLMMGQLRSVTHQTSSNTSAITSINQTIDIIQRTRFNH